MTAAASKYTGGTPPWRIAWGSASGNSTANTLYANAAPVPRAISVNMFRLRVTSDCQPRAKNGQPPQSTTGVARTSWVQSHAAGPSAATRPGASISPIASASTGTVSARLTQKRRVMSTSSWFGPSSAVTSSGSSAMPHFGQLPGPTRRTSGCMGHVCARVSRPAPGMPGAGADGWRKRAGSAMNRSRQLGLQNQ